MWIILLAACSRSESSNRMWLKYGPVELLEFAVGHVVWGPGSDQLPRPPLQASWGFQLVRVNCFWLDFHWSPARATVFANGVTFFTSHAKIDNFLDVAGVPPSEFQM